MTFEEICLHPTYLSFARAVMPQCKVFGLPLFDILTQVKDGRLHIVLPDSVSMSEVASAVGDGLAELLSPEQRSDIAYYGVIAEKTVMFVNRLKNSGRI